jgi:hypothetical protein
MSHLRPALRLAFFACLCSIPASAGYSHYFTWHARPSEASLRHCVGEMRLLIDARRAKLAGPDAEGPPVVEAASLAFNGIGDDNSYEPFFFPGTIERTPPIPKVPSGWNSCKTVGKPYDEVVTACLLVARDHFPPSILAIDSDGSWTEGDWLAGSRLYSSVLHRSARNPIAGEAVPGRTEPRQENQNVRLPSPTLVVALLGAALVVVAVKEVWG